MALNKKKKINKISYKREKDTEKVPENKFKREYKKIVYFIHLFTPLIIH